MYNDLTSAEYVSDVVVAIRPNSLAFVILHSPLSSDLLLIIGDYHTGYRRGGERNGMERKQGWIGFMDSFHIIPPSSQCATLPPSQAAERAACLKAVEEEGWLGLPLGDQTVAAHHELNKILPLMSYGTASRPEVEPKWKLVGR